MYFRQPHLLQNDLSLHIQVNASFLATSQQEIFIPLLHTRSEGKRLQIPRQGDTDRDRLHRPGRIRKKVFFCWKKLSRAGIDDYFQVSASNTWLSLNLSTSPRGICYKKLWH